MLAGVLAAGGIATGAGVVALVLADHNGAGSTPDARAATGVPYPGPARGGSEPVADGSDPNRAGCGPGAVTVERTNVHFPADERSGLLELRYSARCGTAWSRFTPDPAWSPGKGVVVTVWTLRPDDQVSAPYTVPFAGEAVIGDMLRTSRCIVAEVSLAQGVQQSPMATTTCWDPTISPPPPPTESPSGSPTTSSSPSPTGSHASPSPPPASPPHAWSSPRPSPSRA